MTKFYQIVNITRQAYYKQCLTEARKLQRDEVLLSFVRETRIKQARIGTRKLKYLMKQAGMTVGRDYLFSLLKQHRLLVKTKRAYHRTTDSHHRFYCHPNRIKDGFKPERPEELWVADITYLPTCEGNSYVSLITDAYSRKIVGYSVGDNMQTNEVKQAFIGALKKRRSKGSLIHHSDRGSQYCSKEYQDLHVKHKIVCSMIDGLSFWFKVLIFNGGF